MSARSTAHRLCVFMTPADEERFSERLRAELPSVRFVDMLQQPTTATPTFRESLGECGGSHVTLVDTRLVPEDTFHRSGVVPHPSGQGWVYGVVGPGFASLLRARPTEDGLLNGELRATVPSGDAATHEYARRLLAVARDGGARVYGVDPQSREVSRRAERGFVAWPDAAARWGARDVATLTNGPTAWYTVDR